MLTLETIREVLKNHSPKKLAEDGTIQGAVVVPIYQKNSQLYLLVTKRTENLSMHKGQISFPGGKKDPKDKTLLQCALRETFEEIGIPKKKMSILGALDQIKTYGSNIRLSPFVCEICSPFRLKINKLEVEEVIEIPFDELLKDENWSQKNALVTFPKEQIIYYFYYKNWVVWGATAKILYQLVQLVKRKLKESIIPNS